MDKKPWHKHYPPHARGDFKVPPLAVHDLFFNSAQTHPTRICLSFLGKKFSYQTLAQEADKVAAGLQSLGIKKGDRVALCLPNCPYYITSYYGALKIGAVVVNCNPLYTQEELQHLLKDSGAKAVVTLNLKAMLPKVSAAMGNQGIVIGANLPTALPLSKNILFNLFKAGELATLPKDEKHVVYSNLLTHGTAPKAVKLNPQKDLAVLQYTGGTTGLPKGAMLTHSNIVANTEQAATWVGHQNLDGTRILAVLPFFHVFAMTAILNMGTRSGATIIALPRYDLKSTLKTIHKERPRLFGGVPTIYNAISQHNNVSKYDLTSIEFCISGGAGLPKTVKHNFEKLTGCVLVEGYGLSEASPVLACNPLVKDGVTGSIGLPVPGTDIQIRDLENPSKVLSIGEKGELVAKGPQVMPGYWQNDAATKEIFLPGGWLRTGDVGYMSEDGYFYLEDRIKDLILCSGYNVYPRMIEQAFYKHPSVAEVTVIGIPHSYKGEAPKAFVVLKPNTHTTTQELMDFAEEKLNPIERPVEIEIRTQLPKTLIGKLSKKELVAEETAKQKEQADGS
jgi:long-chain acyl-CoA synthetase